VLSEENAADLVAKAAFKTKAEVEVQVVSLRPRTAPRDGVRRRAERQEAAVTSPLALQPPAQGAEREPTSTAPSLTAPPAPVAEALAPAAPTRPSVRPVAADTWSLRVTVDAAFKEELDRLTELLSHKISGGELSAVLREAVHCAIEKHGKRKGAVAPARTRAKVLPPPATLAAPSKLRERLERREPITAEVRRQVWQRDEGRCAWVGPDDHRCGSRWRVEVDHVEAAAVGGPSTLPNLRLACWAPERSPRIIQLRAVERRGRVPASCGQIAPV